MLAVDASFAAGSLSINVDDASDVEISVSGGEVLVNGAAPTNQDSAGDPVNAADVSRLSVTATGEFDNTISLTNVTSADFSSLSSSQVDAGAGNDTVIGSEFGDRLFGGLGNDILSGLGGNDLIVGGAGEDDLDGGEGDDLLDGGGQVAVTVTNDAPASGTLLTPVFLATADGVYDFFDVGASASASLERLAEDGDASGRITAALNSGGVGEATTSPGGPLAPGVSQTVYFNASTLDDLAQYLSYASMVIPSNDAFIGNDDPQQIDLFDDEGNLISRIGGNAFVVTGDAVYDAGTEVNDEVPENTAALAQAAPDTGVTEGGLIRQHEGFQGSQRFGGPIGNVLNAIPGGDFTLPGYDVLSIEISAGDDGGDVIRGGAGDDHILGGAGADLLIGGAGDDTLNGGEGNDQLDGDGRISVTVTNLAPQDGTLITPVFLATADGNYDFFNVGAAASASLERLAEDGNTGPRIEAALNTGAVREAVATPGGPLAPGSSRTVEFDASSFDALARYLSYASMVIPSNDAFVGNDDPQQLGLFDADGNVITRIGDGAFIVTGDDVYDAGTEVNDEVPENTAALAQAAPDTGVTEGGVVRQHPGFQGSERLGGAIGNILDAIPNGDFTADGYEILSIQVEALGGDDTLIGGRGNDSILGGVGDDLSIWNDGDGDDWVEGGEGEDRQEVNGNDGRNDHIRLDERGGQLRIRRFNLGRFQLDVNGVETVAVNTLGGNDHVGTSRLSRVRDLEELELFGGAGRDHLNARGAQNVPVLLDGGDGRDFLFGGDGDDEIFGGAGNDTIFGGRGDDVISGGSGNDHIFGQRGDDTIHGDSGRDFIWGGRGNDEIHGGAGNDVLFGQQGDDIIRGGDGRDILFGELGNDELFGDDGNDYLFGGVGNDLLRGGAGRDRLFGGPGRDDEQQ